MKGRLYERFWTHIEKNMIYPAEGENIPDLEYLWELLSYCLPE